MTEKIYRQDGYEVEPNPDHSLGSIERSDVNITIEWVVDTPAKTEFVLVHEFANGGKEYKEITLVEEAGHWSVTDSDGNEFPYDLESIPDDWKVAGPVSIPASIQRYTPYTQEELDQQAKAKAEAEAAAQKAREREEMLEAMPTTMGDMDAAICELYEMMIGGE